MGMTYFFCVSHCVATFIVEIQLYYANPGHCNDPRGIPLAIKDAGRRILITAIERQNPFKIRSGPTRICVGNWLKIVFVYQGIKQRCHPHTRLYVQLVDLLYDLLLRWYHQCILYDICIVCNS